MCVAAKCGGHTLFVYNFLTQLEHIDCTDPMSVNRLTKIMLLDLMDLCANLFDITGHPVTRKEFLNSQGCRAQSFLNLVQAVSESSI